MWAYYTTVVVVGIGFLTVGVGWTVLALSAGVGLFFGIQHRADLISRAGKVLNHIPKWTDLKNLIHRRGSARVKPKPVEQADRRWMFPEMKLADVRQEGFDALSESFLLLKHLAPYHSAALFEYDSDTRIAYPRLYSTASEGFRKDALLSVSDGVVGYCLSSGKTVHYADFNGDARLLGYYSSQDEIRSVVVFPLDRIDRRLGALVMDSKSPDAFSAKMEEIRHLANLLAELLVRVQREETLLIRLEEDRTLKAMTERMAKAGVSIEAVAESLCNLARDVFPAERVTFVVFDDPASSLGGLPASAEPQLNSPIVRFRSLKMLDRYVELVSRTRKSIRLDDLWENGLMSLATGQTGLSTRSILAAPFVFESQVLGVVLLEADRRRAFNAFHETAVAELVSHASTAVARAIEYGRMEKTCAIADVVPAAADRIFSDPTLESLSALLKSRFGAVAQVFEVIAGKSGELHLRPWETPEAEPAAPSLFQKNSIETGTALIRVDGKVSPAKEVTGELPAGGDLVYPLAAGGSSRPFGLFCLTIRNPLRAESIQILDRIRALVQIRLVLERRERQFGFLKVRDPLTGIFHTAAFEKKLDDQIRHAKPSGARFSLILIHAGRLAAVQRSHGFAECVRRYATLCSEVERLSGPGSTVGRIGPDHIGVLWDPAQGPEALKQLTLQVERLSDHLGFQIQAGSAEFPAAGDSRESLIEAAARIPADVSAAGH